MTAIRAVAETHTGYVRSNNEDLAVVSSDLAAIADGMGGHLGGEVAARTAIEELVESFQRDRTASGLVAAVRRANRAIWRKSRIDRNVRGMGTTLTAVALVAGGGDADGAANHLALVNVGDSRAYRLDRGTSDAPILTRLTVDHSLVEEMVRQGEITPDEALVHPHRHVLTRVLGIDSEVDMDVWDLEALPGMRLLLCSDGMTDDVPEDEIAQVLAASEDPREVARELISHALGHGGLDNVTVVVVDVLADRVPGDEQDLEMVPPRPPMPDIGADEFGADVTQSLPITRSGGRQGGDGVDAVTDDATGASGEIAMAAAAAGTAGLGASDAAQESLAAPAAGLYDRERDEARPAAEADEVADVTDDTAITDVASAAGVAGAADVAEAATTAGVTGATQERRQGRSMTVRAIVPSARAAAHRASSVDAATASHERATVLVSTKRLSKLYRDRIVTFRVFAFLLLLAGLAAGVIGVVTVFQRSAYYVGLSGDQVSIFQGRPGGLLWFKPQLLDTSQVTTKNLLPNSVEEVQRGISVTSYAAAKQEVNDLVRLSDELGMGPGGTTTTTSPGLAALAGTTTTSLAPVATSPPGTAPVATHPSTTTTTVKSTTTTTTVPTTTAPTAPTTPTTKPTKPKKSKQVGKP